MMKPFETRAWLFTALLSLAACDAANQAPTGASTDATIDVTNVEWDDYVIHFNAFTTDQLAADVARNYGITRSKSRAMLNVSIHHKLANGTTEAVEGAVSASAVNLNGQLKTMTLRKVPEETAIYYIGELEITDGEVLIYTIDATPQGEPSRFTVRFKKQFFVEQ